MTKWLLLLLTALVSAPAALAQTSSDYSRYEFYGGYAYQRAANNTGVINGAAPPISFNDIRSNKDRMYEGFTGEFNQNLWRHVGLVTSFTGVYDRTPYIHTATFQNLRARAQRYDLLFGPRYNFRMGRFNPFVEAMAGFEHMRINFNGTETRADTAFAMALGGGLDVHVSHHFDIRPIQLDYLPTFYNGTHQNNYRVGAGVKVKLIDP